MPQQILSERICANCGRLFRVDPRVGDRHRFCSRARCIRASRKASQQKWLSKPENRQHFTGLSEIVRVQEWRERHPCYWRRNSDRAPFALPKAFRSVMGDLPLQDSIDPQLLLVIGVVSHLCGSALQETIASEVRRLILAGHGILQTTAADPGPPT